MKWVSVKSFIFLMKKKIRMSYDQILAKFGSLIGTYSKRNIYAPLIWISGFIITMLGIIMFSFKEYSEVRYTCLVFILLITIFDLVMYVIIFVKDPKLLQSERFRLEDKKLDMMASKGSEIKFNPVNLSLPNELPEKE